MALFEKLFGQKDKEITSRDLKVALLGVKRDRKRSTLELRKLGIRSDESLKKLKKARKEGNHADTDLYYDEIKGIQYEQAMVRRDAKVLNLEAIGLNRYIRGLERLEKTSDKGKIRGLMERVRTSGLDEKLRAGEIDETAYLDMLNSHMEEIGIEVEEMEAFTDEDPNKEAFLKDLDAIISAEEQGDLDVAIEREEELKKKIEEPGETEDV